MTDILMTKYKIEEGDTDEGDIWLTVFGFQVQVMRNPNGDGISISVWPDDPDVILPIAEFDVK